MRALRAFAFNLAFFGFTLLLGVAGLPLLLMGPPRVMWLMRTWAHGVLWLLRVLVGLHVRVTGREHLPVSGGALVAAKHQSAFDTVVWFTLLPDCAYVVKRELLFIPVYGWIANKGGMIAVDRGAGASAMRGLLRDGPAALAAGRQVVIFPEGTRVAVGADAPYHPGIAALYKRARLPVVPVGTDSGRFWGRRAFMKHPGTITVAILPPIPPGLSREKFLATLRDGIENASNALLPPRPGVASPVDKSGESAS